MARTTIDFGIDLGTTNSAVAVLNDTEPTVIKNNLERDITASAVYLDRRGNIYVGDRARGRLEDTESVDDTKTEFKKNIGYEHNYHFKSTDQSMTPEQLSAEVLKSLRGDVLSTCHEELRSAVITVPAAFDQKQCAATKKAGELAGLVTCPLVQEPVAAALAYGFQRETAKEYWLVYDFGGGTFDAAVMQVEEGTILVVNHGGDNNLGGSEIDWAVVEKLVLPEVEGQYNLPEFNRSNKRWNSQFARIKRAVEEAKIDLSQRESSVIEVRPFLDVDGNEVDIYMTLNRDQLIGIAEPIIMKSVRICQNVLKEKSLSPAAIAKVILVGGPTLAPYFREILASNLRIPLDDTHNPLTVVACGAAVFAATQQMASSAVPKAAKGSFLLELKYKPVGADEDPTVRGIVHPPETSSVEGHTIEFVRADQDWRSGKIPLPETGRFRLNLLATRGPKNIYEVELLDATGNRQEVVHDEITYRIGMAISEQPVLKSLGLALANNEYAVFFTKGDDTLPAKATDVFRTATGLRKGETGEILRIPVVEGDNERADHNPLQDFLSITGTDIRRDLPAGSEVEVTLYMDASRIIRAKAYVPILDEEFETIIDPAKQEPQVQDLQKQLAGEQSRWRELEPKLAAAGEDLSQSESESGSPSQQIQEAQHLVKVATGDNNEVNHAEARVRELRVKMDILEEKIQWPALVNEANEALDNLDGLAAAHGTRQQSERAETLREDIEKLIEQKSADRLKKKLEQVMDLHREILFARPEFWIAFFNDLVKQQARMTDQNAALRLINQGHQCIQRGNVQGLRNAVVQLLGLLPRDVAEAVQRGYGSGILR